MRIHSTRFGELTISEDQLLRFLDGLPGFPDEKIFAFLPSGEDNPFVFLQSANNADLSFVLIEPFPFFKDYTFELADDFAVEMGLSEKNPPQVFCIVTLRQSLDTATVNMLAPIIVNWQNRTAVQIVLEKTTYTTRHKLFPNGLPRNKATKGGK